VSLVPPPIRVSIGDDEVWWPSSFEVSPWGVIGMVGS